MALELLARRRRLLTLSGSMSHDSAPDLVSTGVSLAEHDLAREARMSTIEMTYCDENWVGGGVGRPTEAEMGDDRSGDSSDDTGDRGGDEAGGVRMKTRDEDVARMRFAACSRDVLGVMVWTELSAFVHCPRHTWDPLLATLHTLVVFLDILAHFAQANCQRLLALTRHDYLGAVGYSDNPNQSA